MINDSFNLSDVAATIRSQWKRIAFFVLCCLAVATALLFIVPPQYRSTTTVVAANPALADKARLFNTNIQGLYSVLGNGDDADALYSIATLDTVFYRLVDLFSLVQYYHPEGSTGAIRRRNAMKLLRKDLTVKKGEESAQLKITAWTKDALLSASLANSLAMIVQQDEQNIWMAAYRHTLHEMQSAADAMRAELRLLNDSMKNIGDAQLVYFDQRRQSLLSQIDQYQRSAAELQLAMETMPPALYVTEKATAAPLPEWPDKAFTLAATLICSAIFGMIFALVFEPRKKIPDAACME